MLSRALNFRVFAVTEAVGAAAFGLVAILLAARGYGVWAIAWAGVAQSLSRAVILVARAGWPLRFGWDRGALGDLLGLGAGLTLKRVINYAAANVDYAVIGRRLGPTDLGYYTRAYGLITMPLSQFSRVIMSVLFPAFSRIQGDNARIVAGYSKVVTATAIVSFPFLAGLALVAPAFMAVVYGEKWLPTVLPLTIMCVAGMMKSVTTFVGAIADAKGQVQREVKRQLIYLGILVAGAILGSRYGTAGVAWAVVVASFAMLIMMQSFLGSLTGMRWRTYLAALWPAVASTLVMTAVVAAVQAGMSRLVARTSVAMLTVSVVAGVLSYALALVAGRFPAVTALRRELERDLKELRRGRQGGARPPAAVQSSPTCQESRS
jgi:O-antigen/teichoic acid export membrane protein